MKKRLIICSLFLILSASLCACSKQICSYCGQEDYCDEYDILGTTRFICDTCLANPESSLSGNVINEYAATPYDFGTASDNESNGSQSNPAVSENASATPVSDNNSDNSATTMENTSDNNSSAGNPSTGTDNAVATSTATKDSVLNALAAKLSSASFQLSPDESDSNVFYLYSGSQNLNIRYVFSTTASGKVKLSIEKLSGASSSDYTCACIYSALAFLNSDDYNGTGYNVYNSTCQYGNYTYGGCRFYFMENTQEEANQGLPLATFDISYQ